jgi:hypothetical protein
MGLSLSLCVGNCGTLTGIANTIFSLINNVAVPLVFAIAFIVFIWGVFSYFILGADDETKRETGRTYIIYGLIGFFVMLSVWGLVNVLTNTFGLESYSRPAYPKL